MDTMRDISREEFRLQTALERAREVDCELLTAEQRVKELRYEAEDARRRFNVAAEGWRAACYERDREQDADAEERDRPAGAGMYVCSHTTSDGGPCQVCAAADDMPF